MKFEDSLVGQKAYAFALDIIKTKRVIEKETKEYDLARQLLRSGTSIGANIAEACGGLTPADFSAKISISYKEGLETKYWISLLRDSEILASDSAAVLLSQCEEISKMLFTILKRSGRVNH
jgi:four helix bundle protein